MSVAHYTANSLAEFVEQICKIKNSLRQNGAEFNEVSLFVDKQTNRTNYFLPLPDLLFPKVLKVLFMKRETLLKWQNSGRQVFFKKVCAH